MDSFFASHVLISHVKGVVNWSSMIFLELRLRDLGSKEGKTSHQNFDGCWKHWMTGFRTVSSALLGPEVVECV